MEKLAEKLKELVWIQLVDGSLVLIPKTEKDQVVSAKEDLTLYWVNLGRLLELLGKDK